MKKKFSEDVPTNATGPAVVGTGDDKTTWKRKKKKKVWKRKKLKGTTYVGAKPDPELVLKQEGKNMDWLHKLIDQGKSAEEISRIMELDRDTIEALMERNYRKEYDNYHSKPEQREKNAARLRARRLMVKRGKVKKNDKKDVHHKDNNRLNNLSVTTQNYNRKEPRLREDATTTDTLDLTPDSTFARLPVFKVSSGDFVRCQQGKKRYARWNKHIDTNSDYGKKNHAYAKKNPKQSIIVQSDKTGHMIYLKKYSQLEKE